MAELTVMDPCCGSGHFLVEAFSMLWQMRAEEEGTSLVAAQDAVLRDNLFGLELDPRCVQIAMFAVALQAWKASGGWRQLPVPNVACSGIPVRAPVEEWKALAEGDGRLENALVRLHILFRDAHTLGSLIDPKRATELTDHAGFQASFDDVEWAEVAPLLEKAVQFEERDPATAVLGADAAGIARAADYLSRHYTLVCTNPPFLKRANQNQALTEYCDLQRPDARQELALAMTDRLTSLSTGKVAVVLPSGWLFMSWHRKLRQRWLRDLGWDLVAQLGTGAFTSISGEVVNVALMQFSPIARPGTTLTLDAAGFRGAEGKSSALRTVSLVRISQIAQQQNKDSIFSLGAQSDLPPLERIASGYAGIQTGDYPRFGRSFWELQHIQNGWARQQSTVRSTVEYGGREHVLLWQDGEGELVNFVRDRLGDGKEGAWIRGANFKGRRGVALSSMSDLPVSLYDGDLFDNNTAVIIPNSPEDLAAVWAFAESGELSREVRKIDTSIKVTNATFVKVPFDVDYWRGQAAERFPHGLPEPFSDDPTQWLFKGRPEVSREPLQVAVARLVGYRWPEQAEADELAGFADADGIVCLPSVAGEAPAADRLQQLLAAAYGDGWSPPMAAKLLADAGSKKNLADWLRDEFFKHHCSVFQNRPFVWHVWDGLRDGFSAFVNYHRLDRKTLEKLTYTYLGTDWVERQRAEARDDVTGAEARLSAALELQRKLELVLEGEAPFDVYVRWKSLAEQPIGWDPDLNDGVRLNIRPFVEAGILRSSFSIHWRKDRGANLDGSERHNDIHLTLADKTNARAQWART